MVNNEEITCDFEFKNIELENQYFTDTVLKEHPKVFEEMKLRDGSNVAILSNDALITKEDKQILPPYMYIVLSKYGITQFNASTRNPLGWEIMNKAITGIIELSNGQEVGDLLISEWKPFPRNRINKYLIKLRSMVRSLTVSGVHFTSGVRDFYENVLSRTSLF